MNVSWSGTGGDGRDLYSTFIMMTLFRRTALFTAGLCLWGGALDAAPPLARLIPEDAAVVVSLRRTPEFAKALKASPLGLTIADEQVRRFFAPMLVKMNWESLRTNFKEKTGAEWEEMLGWVEGDVMLSLNDFSFLLDPATQHRPPLVLAMELGANAPKMAQVLTQLPARDVESGRATVETETFAGVTLHVVQYTRDATAESATPEPAPGQEPVVPRAPAPYVWAVVDGLVVASAQIDAVKTIIDAVQRGGVDAPLERAARWVRLQQRADNPAFSLVLHVPAILPALQEAIDTQAGAGRPNPFGLDMSRLLSTLGLDAWGDLYLTLHTDAGGTVNYYGLTATESRGLLKLFEPTEGTFAKPAWLPAQWTSVGTFRYSLKNTYQGLEEMLRSLSPALDGMVQGQISSINKQLGIDVKRDFFGSLGDDLLQVQFAPDLVRGTVPDQLYGVSLTNAGQFTRAMEGLKKLGGPAMEKLLEKRDYLGHAIYSFASPAPDGGTAAGMSYVVTDRWFLFNIGGAAPIEAALQGMAGQGASFWEKPEVRAALATVPDTATGFQYQDVAVLLSAMLDGLAGQGKAPAAGTENEGEGAWVDASEKPGLDVIRRYWSGSVNFSFRDAEGFHGVARLQHPQP